MLALMRWFRHLLILHPGWNGPIYPDVSLSAPDEEYDLLAGVQDEPVSNPVLMSMMVCADQNIYRSPATSPNPTRTLPPE